MPLGRWRSHCTSYARFQPVASNPCSCTSTTTPSSSAAAAAKVPHFANCFPCDYRSSVDRVQHITALVVTLSHNVLTTKHIDTVMASCVRTRYGLHELMVYASGLSAVSLPINRSCKIALGLCLPCLVGLC